LQRTAGFTGKFWVHISLKICAAKPSGSLLKGLYAGYTIKKGRPGGMAHWFIIVVRSLVGNSENPIPAEAADEFDAGNISVLLHGLASPAEARASIPCGSSPSRSARPGSTTSLRFDIYALSSFGL
jgi:hypothetical protein